MDHEIVITRVFDAPRKFVFQAWTEPERMTQWFGPAGWTETLDRLASYLAGDGAR